MLLPSAMLPERATPEAPQGWWQAHLHLLESCALFDSGRTQAASKFSKFGGGVKYEMDKVLGCSVSCLISRNSLRNVYDSAHT